MFSPSRISCSSAGQQKSSVPCPASARPRDEASNSLRGTTRFPPPETPVRLSNAVTGRTVLHYWNNRSYRPLGSELRQTATRKPFQPVKLLSLLWCGLRTLSVAAFRVFRFITDTHLTTFHRRLQARTRFLHQIVIFGLSSSQKRVIVAVTLCRMRGTRYVPECVCFLNKEAISVFPVRSVPFLPSQSRLRSTAPPKWEPLAGRSGLRLTVQAVGLAALGKLFFSAKRGA